MTTTPDRTLSNFDENAHHIAKRQYLQAGDGDLGGMFRRIADWVAGAEAPEARLAWAQKYYDLMAEKRFCPGGRVLAGAGTQHGNVLNCFVQGATEHAPESFDGVMEVAKKLALVTKVGGGNGVNLDVYTPRAVSSRPDAGVRGWAYMSATHPDVTDFIEGLMRPPTQPDGEKQPVAVRNWTRVVYGHAIPPELVASARVNGVQIVRALPQGVQPVPDDMGGIIDAARAVAESAKVGVEPRIDLSEMRPEGAPIQGSGGTSSGPVSFLMEIFDNFLEWANRGGETSGPINTLRFVYAPVLRVVRQGGTRRGAGMATISIEHPDVLDFLTAKDLDREAAEGDISTFNISILVTEKFWQTLERDGLWHVDVQEVPGKYYLEPQSAMYDGRLPTLPDRAEDGARGVPLYKTAPQGRYNPADKRPGIPAKWLWDQIAQHAWATGEPGLIFVDRVNEYSALKNLGKRYEIRSTNPCGEIPLTVGEPCDLGAINLAAYVRGSTFDYASFRADVRTCVRFLDDVLDVNVFALEDNRVASQDLRRLGLGVMGLADALIKMGLRYDSEAGRQAIYEIMSALREEAVAESERLGQERGVYPVYERNAKKIPHGPRRNVAVLTVAPTGTTSMLMGVSSGIEPIFSPFIWRKIGSEYRALLAPLFVELLNQYPAPAGLERDGGWDWDKVTEAVSENHGSVVGLAFIPEALQQVFVCAHDIKPEDHVRMQGTVQRAFDDGGQHAANSLSKCIAAGTLIPTSAGLVAIEDFARTLEDDTFTPLDGTLTVDGHRITQHYRAGVKPATRITLDSGATLVGATASHRVLTPEGWRLMSELRPGDTVLGKFLASHGVGGLPIEWTDEYRTNALPVQTPKAMTPALARFLGMLAADGHTTESTGNVGLTCKDAEVETEFTRLCQEVFGLTPRRTVDQRNGVVCLSLTSRNLARYVEALIGKGAYHKHAPKQLLRGSAEEKQAFLEGLTLDGYVWEGGLCLYAGMSEQLAYHAAEMARSFGLPKVYQGRKRVEASGKTCHLVSVSNEMQEILTPVESRKKVKPTQSWYRVHVPAATIAATRLPTSHAGYTNFKSVRGRGALTCKNTSAEQIGWDTGVLAYRVMAVEDAGMVEMYDIEVEGSHAYVVNGMISHNTINLPNSATVQDVQDAYSEAYRTGCKGITVYRDGSRQFQVLSTSKKKEKKAEPAQAAAEVMGESAPEAPKVETPPAPAPAPAAPARPAQPTTPVYERPARLSGITDMVKLTDPTSGHRRSFLVTVNHLNGKPIEVMVISGRAGDEANADSEALGRVVSIALQHGVPAQALIKTLRGINGGLYGSYNGRLVGSKADLIAVALETFGKDMEAAALPPLAGASVDLPPALPATPSGVSVESMDGMSRERCPVCEEKAVIREEGCLKCQACGYSKCG